MGYLHTFKIYYLKNNIEQIKTFNKFCYYPKKTKLYKEIEYLLNSELIYKYEITINK